MVTAKGVKIQRELTEDFDIADYANHVYVAITANEVILTFFQVITPVTDDALSEPVPARPVARVAIPVAVAQELAGLLSVPKVEKE